MYRSIYFKIVSIFAVFMVTVMVVVTAVLINGVFGFYTNEFVAQLDAHFKEGAQLRSDLESALSDESYAALQKDVLTAYSTALGIDDYRHFYICDQNGTRLESSTADAGYLQKTPNLLRAMNGEIGVEQTWGSLHTDYAVPLSNGSRSCIIYIYDTQEEMEALAWQIFTIILQALLIGLIIAVILSFVLSKAITAPIQNITRGANRIAKGEFSQKLVSYSNDEIGVLTDTFNDMSSVLKNTLDEVSGEREKLETVFSYLQDAVLAFTVDGRILNINKSAVALLGRSYNENLSFDRFLELLDIGYVSDYIENGEDNGGQFTLRDVVFDDKALDINIGRLRYIEDKQIREGTIAVIHDITARYELDKAQREFVANVSHELRTPLTSIKGATETLLMYPDMNADMRDNFLNMAVEECNRMLRIVMDLLTLSRLDNHKTKWKVARFDLKQTLIHICQVMQVESAAHRHSLRLTVPESLPEMVGDAERIEQVLINILSNAVKYTPDGGEIEVSAEHRDGFTAVSIQDNGIGIPAEDLPRLFERFYRVEKARTSEMGGTGLGLAIAKEIIAAHGGSINISSEVGKGTLVTITLPLDSKLKGEEN